MSYFQRALAAPTIEVAESSINKALNLYNSDVYWRTYSQIYLVKLSSLTKDKNSLSEEDKATLQTTLSQAVNGARLAITYDSTNYLNFQALGSVYKTAAIIGVKDAYLEAIKAYNDAGILNPFNPGIKLSVADAYLISGKNKEAKESAQEALTLKPDYIEALIFLSQISKSESDNKSALSYAQTALSYAPTNEDLIKYVKSLQVSSSSATTDKAKDDSKKTSN